MTEATSAPDSRGVHPSSRPLSRWIWLPAALLYPMGFFLAFGLARLLPWWQAVALAIVSYLSIAGSVGLMTLTNGRPSNDILSCVLLLIFIIVFCSWGVLHYYIGRRAAYWSAAALRDWRLARIFAGFFLGLGILNLLLGIGLNLFLRSHPLP